MKKMLFHFILPVLFILPVFSLSAYDWGILLDQSGGIENVNYLGGKTSSVSDGINYSGTLIPWFSTPFGGAGKFFLSAGFTMEYANEELTFLPQLFRTDFSRTMENGGELRAGRMQYADPLGFVANGLFDGAQYSFDIGKMGTLGIGIFYTGLLDKKNANITMTGEDLQSYYTAIDYSDFTDTYFASRRLMAAVDWNYPDITDWLRLKVALIGQFDVNGREESYHSQYLMARGTIPWNQFVFDLRFCMEAAEMKKEYADQIFRLGFAGELGIGWRLPTAMRSQLSFTGRFSSGTTDEDGIFTAFVPITTETQGDVLMAKLSGLSMLRLDYTARPSDAVSFNLAASYFILSDLGTYNGFPTQKDGHFLGSEFSGLLVWAPYSDLRITLGGGVFLPSLGNADNISDPLWSINLNAILVIF